MAFAQVASDAVHHWSGAAGIRRPLRDPPTVNGRSFQYLVCRTIGLDDLPGPRSYDDLEQVELAAI